MLRPFFKRPTRGKSSPCILEAWLEKDALSGIFQGALRPYGVTLDVGRGFDSATSAKDAADRFGDGEVALVGAPKLVEPERSKHTRRSRLSPNERRSNEPSDG